VDLDDQTADLGDQTEDRDDQTEDLDDQTEDLGDQTEDLGDQTENLDDQTEDLEDQTEDLEDQTEDLGVGFIVGKILSPPMRILALLLLAATLAGCATASAPPAPSPDSDEFRIEATVLAVYNVISGPAGRRDWNRFEALFAPEGRLTVVGDKGPVSMTTKEFIERVTPNVTAKGFFEKPVATRLLIYGNIAHVWSTYETREAASQEKPDARGINSFEMVRIGGEWKVQSILWEKEDAAHPIPPQFAPQ